MPTDDKQTPSAVLDALMAQAREMAHEIGNPLSGLGLSLDMLAQTELSPSQQRYVARSQHACERMFTLQNDWSALAGGGHDIKQWHDVHALCREAARYVGRDVIDDDGATSVLPRLVRLQCPPEAQQVFGKGPLLTRAIAHLLRNADEAAPEQALTVKVAKEHDGVALRIIDHGSGVPPALCASLFRARCSQKERGMGLGLLYVALIVDRQHQGTATYEGHDQGCTTFKLWLPIAP